MPPRFGQYQIYKNEWCHVGIYVLYKYNILYIVHTYVCYWRILTL